jgi:capsular polysaccharide biosynthesis protein
MQPIRGVFSAAEAIDSGDIKGNFICRSQPIGSCEKDSLTQKVGESHEKQNNLQPWPVFWAFQENAHLTGKLLHWRNSSNQISLEGEFYELRRRNLRDEKILSAIVVGDPTPLPGAWTSIVSKWGTGGNYYHWMLDCLARLLVWENLPESTKILIPQSNHKFVSETLEMLGIANQCLSAPSDHVVPERFYFCSPTAMTGAWNPIAYDWLRDKFSPYRSPSPTGKPIFLTRRGSTRVPLDIQEIETLFKENGFKIVDCGSLTVKEQIWIASCSPAIAGLHGAAMTNILWSHPATPVLELFESDYLNGCYEQIANHGNLRYSFIINDSNNYVNKAKDWINKIKLF